MGNSPTGFRKIFEERSPWLGEALIEVDNRYEAMVLGKDKEMGYTLMPLQSRRDAVVEKGRPADTRKMDRGEKLLLIGNSVF